MQDLINQIAVVILTSIAAYTGTILTHWWNENQALIESKMQQIQQAMGIEKYNKDIKTAKILIGSIEQQAIKNDWIGVTKRSKACSLIQQYTGLTNDQIGHIIESTVNEFKMNTSTIDLNKLTVPGTDTKEVTVLRLADDGKYKEEKATIPVEVASLEEPAAVEEVPAAEPVAEATPIVEPVVNPQSITINGIEYVPATA